MKTFDDFEMNRSPGILIVDADAQTRAELVTAFKAQGWRVWIATDGQSAIDTLRVFLNRIDIDLVDLQLPHRQGATVLAELAKINPDLVRGAISGDISPYAAAAFRRTNDIPLFTKPLALRALVYTLTEMIVRVERLMVAS
ncbi:MAG: response regulator [Planctomycetes bacterium]|nr:response regulator [Planctomycetota bacterium]